LAIHNCLSTHAELLEKRELTLSSSSILFNIQLYPYIRVLLLPTGWEDTAYVQFDELCKRIREQRQTTLNKKLEQMYLAKSHSLLVGGGPHSQRMGGLVETNVEVYNKLDSEEED
jgi:hypothetical protein